MTGFIIKSREMLKCELLSSKCLDCMQTCIACQYEDQAFYTFICLVAAEKLPLQTLRNSQQPFKILFKDEKKNITVFLCFVHTNLGIFDKFALENDIKQRVSLCTHGNKDMHHNELHCADGH